MTLSPTLTSIVQQFADCGGRTFIVGGAVRDEILGLHPKDIDLEVFGLEFSEILAIIRGNGIGTDVHGQSFPVVIAHIDGQFIDIAIPRRERKTGVGHTAFEFEADPHMSLEDAVMRRDFTINALMQDALTGEVLDPTGHGLSDLQNRLLRHVGPQFAEDPLRVMRGAQFAARFGLRALPETIEMCRGLLSEADSLSTERIWGEWFKLLAKGNIPSYGIRFLVNCGWISLERTPQIFRMIGIEQDPEWHPEGDVFTHTMMVVDAAAVISREEGLSTNDRLVAVMAALCHDFGKVTHTFFRDGRFRSPGHDVAGVQPALDFMDEIGATDRIGGENVHLRDRVTELVRRHMVHCGFRRVSTKIVRKLQRKLTAMHSNIPEWARLVHADNNGRGIDGEMFGLPEQVQAVLDVFNSMDDDEVQLINNPIFTGHHLIERGLTPGPLFGQILNEMMERQIDEQFDSVESGADILTTVIQSATSV